MILSSSCDNNLETVKCDCDSPAESDRQEFLWELKPLDSPTTSDSVFYEESHFCSKIDDTPFKPCRSVHTISENPAIEIRDESTISVDLPPISWHGYNSIPKFLNICNVGRNVLINGQWPNGKPYIQGGPLNGSYIFSQIHFHAPSEHEIDGKRFPLEMHVVHYKTNYLTQERAMEEKDGTIVLVYLFEVKDSCDTVLSLFTKQNAQLNAVPRQSEVTGVPLNHIVKPFYSHYYIYWGCINTMKKSYLLQWIINCSNLYATEQEVYDIFHLMEGGNSTGRRVPLMKPVNNAVYYAGGYNIALIQEETATQCNNSYLTEVPTMSQSCQTFNSVEANQRDIQLTSNENCTNIYKRFKLRFEKFESNGENGQRKPRSYYVLEEDSEKKIFAYETEGSSVEIPLQCLNECQTCKLINCTNRLSHSHPSMENCHCHCHHHSKRQKKLKGKQKHKRKGSKCSVEISSQCLDECQTCKNLKCMTQNKHSKCKKNGHYNCKNQKKQKKKRKRKQEDSDSSVGTSSQDFVECQTCKNLKCTIKSRPSECEKNCDCHYESQKKLKEKKSNCSVGISSQDLDECQTCKNLKCTTQNMPLECEKNCDCHCKSQKKQKKKRKCKQEDSDSSVDTSSQDFVECQTCRNLKCTIKSRPSECEENCDCHCESQKKLKEKKSNCSEGISWQDFDECQTCKNLKCTIKSRPSECEENCDCHYESQKKPKKKLKFKLRKKVAAEEESSDSEENCKVKSKGRNKTKKKKGDDMSEDCSGPESSENKSIFKSIFKSSSKNKVADSDNCPCPSDQKSRSKKCAKTAPPKENPVNYVLTPFNVQKGPTVPRVLYKTDENKKTEDKNAEVCNFVVSENSPSAFASIYRLPQLKTTEPLKEFFLQTEHLFHTEKKGGFSMCTSQDYHVTIVYNHNILQEFRGTFSPKKLQLGTYEKLYLSPVYPEPENVIVHLEDCFVKMETLNKLYIRAKFLLRQSFLNLSPSTKSDLLKEAGGETDKLVVLNSNPKTKFLDTQETYLLTFKDGDQTKSTDQFMTPKSSLNEKEKQSNKLIPEKKEWKKKCYEIELLKRPPDEVETSKSNIFETDQLYETKIKKEKSQKTLAIKCDKFTKDLITRSKKNLFIINSSTEKDETLNKKALSGKLKTKNETLALREGKALSLTNELLSTTEKGLGIKNTHFIPFTKKDLKNQNCETLTERQDMKIQPLPKNKESIKLDKEKNTVLLYYYDPENFKSKGFKSSKSKNLALQDKEAVTTPDVGPPEDLNKKKSKPSFPKTKVQKPPIALDSQNARKLKNTNVKAILPPDSQKDKKKAFTSMIPISTKRKQQKQP